MPFRINATALLDDQLREQKPRFSRDAIAKFLMDREACEALSLLAFARVKGAENRIPLASIMLRRVQSDVAPQLVLCTTAPDDTILPAWLDAVGTDWPVGDGAVSQRINLDFDYGPVIPRGSFEPTPEYNRFIRVLKCVTEQPGQFAMVARGALLRSVHPVMLMPAALFENVRPALDEVVGETTHRGEQQVLWRIECAKERKQAFDQLHNAGLVFDPEFVDLPSYQPTSTTFAIPG